MKTLLSLLLVSALSIASAYAQGSVFVDPIPINNTETGLPAGNNFSAGLYFALGNATEDSLVLLNGYLPLSNGYAYETSPVITVPPYVSGPITFQVRAASNGYTYESAIASGLSSVLAGKSTLLVLPSLGPGTQTLSFPGFNIQPVPEPSTGTLALLAGITAWKFCQRKRG